jgi:hypothetical protein
MRSAVDGAYPDQKHFLRLHKERIVAHSNRVTAAVALANAGMSMEQTAFRLQWWPSLVQHYLRETSMQADKDCNWRHSNHLIIISYLSERNAIVLNFPFQKGDTWS